MIKIRNLYKSYTGKQIFNNISLDVEKEEVLALIGFSGCGKSTLLKIITGLTSYDKGSVELTSDNLGMCFQYSALFDSMTVEENIAFALRDDIRNKEITRAEASQLIAQKLKLVGLAGKEKLYPSQLSGGMKKRVAFARAIISDPHIILYDEPTAGLDPVASTIIEDLMVTLQQKTKATSIVVTHQESTIKRTATKIALLYNTKIVWHGTRAEFFSESNTDPYVKQFRQGELAGPMKVNI